MSSTVGGWSASPTSFTRRLAASSSGAVGAHRLPGVDEGDGIGVGPREVEVGRCRRREEPKAKRRDHAELAAAAATQRPEQVGVLLVVALDDAPVGQHDPGADQLIAGQPVLAAEDPEATAEGQAGDADGWARAGRDRDVVFEQLLVDVAELRARPDRCHVADTDTERIGETSMRIPRVEERPA